MKLSTGVTRTHEWLAQRCSFVQFPNVDPFRRPKLRPPFFKHQMPWYMRIGLFFFGICLVLFSGALLVAFGVAAWALLG